MPASSAGTYLSQVDERINDPSSAAPSNWTYRFRPFIEEIVSHDGLAAAMKSLIH